LSEVLGVVRVWSGAHASSSPRRRAEDKVSTTLLTTDIHPKRH